MTDRAMVTLTIDGTEVTVPKGTTVLEAAKRAGVLIPHYCYHPGLPVAGVCRMCLVEIEGMPKLAISCATEAADGQVVKVFSDTAHGARQSVLEFLLINHPLDCPICDQAGECELQDYVFNEGRARSRLGELPKRFNPVEDFGDDILYVPNRCILCTRCVRFMDHVAEDAVINVSERGDRAYIGIHPDERLDHPWAGNVVDLCPVGSLLSKDSLHKARAWELDKTPSICTACSQGCNITIDTRNDAVVRLRPRPNDEVNRYFMCDHGRHHYRWMNRGDRIEAPLIRHGEDLQATDWDQALDETVRLLRGLSGRAVILASPDVSNEALFLARTVLEAAEVHAAFRVSYVSGEVPLPGVPNLALREERAANAAGARALGYDEAFDGAVAGLAGSGTVLVLGESLDGIAPEALAGAGHVIYLGPTLPDAARPASVVLPLATVAEEDGTLTNRDGRVQRYLQARRAPGMARPAWWVLAEILVGLHPEQDAPLSAEEVFDRLAREVTAFAGMSYERLGIRGAIMENPLAAGAKA